MCSEMYPTYYQLREWTIWVYPHSRGPEMQSTLISEPLKYCLLVKPLLCCSVWHNIMTDYDMKSAKVKLGNTPILWKTKRKKKGHRWQWHARWRKPSLKGRASNSLENTLKWQAETKLWICLRIVTLLLTPTHQKRNGSDGRSTCGSCRWSSSYTAFNSWTKIVYPSLRLWA